MRYRIIIAASALAVCFSLNMQSAQSRAPDAQEHGTTENEAVGNAPSDFFDTLKIVMTGNWEGTFTNGTFEHPTEWKPLRVEYRLTARGTAIIEDYLYSDGPAISMSTVYFRDRGDLRLTHYCGAKNHPSMVATMLDPDKRQVRFDFTNISNLQTPTDYHSRQFELDIVTEDHIRIQYHGLQNGKIASQAYDLKRSAP